MLAACPEALEATSWLFHVYSYDKYSCPAWKGAIKCLDQHDCLLWINIQCPSLGTLLVKECFCWSCLPYGLECYGRLLLQFLINQFIFALVNVYPGLRCYVEKNRLEARRVYDIVCCNPIKAHLITRACFFSANKFELNCALNIWSVSKFR